MLGRLQAVVVVVAVAIPLVTAKRAHDLPPPIGVQVGHEVHYVPPDTVFGDLVRKLHLHARNGSLFDVTGKVLRPAEYPGRILLNGRVVRKAQLLADGDEIRVLNGHDQTEPRVRQVIALPGNVFANPQFYLTSAPGEEIVTKGKISGKVVGSEIRNTGPETTPNAVALTFDDGPSPLYTPQILNILEHFGVKATFFTIGFQVEEHPDLIRAELDAGMVVGNHSWSHPESPPFRELPPNRMRHEMLKATAAIRGAGGDPFVFRPPGGTFDEHEVAVASSLGLRVVIWAVDPEDWRNDAKANQIVDNVLSHVDAGDIIVMHDGGGYQDATVAALPKIIRGIRAMGLGFVTLTR